jgi:hypothetical protein
MKSKILIIILLLPICLCAQHSFELGTGWGNMGLSPETTWKPYSCSQGSRKEVNAAFTYGYVGENRVYYAPFAGLFYINTWSMTGAMNLGTLNLGLGGLGVYMSKPMAAYSPEERVKKWFATFEINFASVTIGGNITPNYGGRGKNSGVREWSEPDSVFGNQHYPFKDTYNDIHKGRYVCFQYSIPITIRVWKMLTPKLGFGMFLASNVFIVEQSLNFKSPCSIGYDMRAGFSLMLFNPKKT